MTLQEQRGLLAVALMAAFADGQKADAEREEIKRIAESMGAQAAGLNVMALLQDVLLKRVTMAQAVADLKAPEHRQLAYELALGVCDADGAQSAAEVQFLAALKQQLGADAGVNIQADALAAITDAPASVPVDAALQAPAAGRLVDRAALDSSIKNCALLCGALELLPQSWASMAIIPLQVKMVYGIGQAHGAQLDATMVKEFIAAAGVGLTSQYIEQFGRKLLGGLLGSVMGGIGRGVGSAGGGMAMSFATTYALGQLAVRYYGGGRQMNTQLLRDTYQDLLGSARQMQGSLLPQIQERARTLDAGKVLDMVRQPLSK
jgi:uncharacterized protein (DUF697 family)/tellurite resistance protein